MGQKFTRNRSISYGFQDIYTFLFSAKIQHGRHKLRKLKIFTFQWDILVLPCGPKIHPKITLSLTVCQIFTLFYFLLKSKMATIEIFPFCIRYPCTALWTKNSLKIALSLTVSEIFSIFYFPLKSKMAAKSSVNFNFSFLHRIISYYPLGRKSAQNRSIYNRF